MNVISIKKVSTCAPPTLHSRSILGATTDNEGQYEMKTRLEKTLSEQLLALSFVVCYGSSMWCREEDLNLHGVTPTST
jgi:hypothetical protein